MIYSLLLLFASRFSILLLIVDLLFDDYLRCKLLSVVLVLLGKQGSDVYVDVFGSMFVVVTRLEVETVIVCQQVRYVVYIAVVIQSVCIYLFALL